MFDMKMFNYFKKNKKNYYIFLIFAPLSVFADVGISVLLRKITDAGNSGNLKALQFLVIISFLYILIASLTDYIYRMSMTNILASTTDYIRKSLYNRLFSRPMLESLKKDLSYYISLFINDLEDLKEYYYKNFCFAYHELIYFVSSMYLLLNINLILTLTILIFAFLQFLVSIIFDKIIGEKQKILMSARECYISYLSEHIDNFNIIKLFKKEILFAQKHDIASNEWKNTEINAGRIKKIIYELSFASGLGMYLGTMIVGFFLVSSGKITIGQVIEASQLMSYVAKPMLSLSEITTNVKASKPLLEKFNNELEKEILEEKYKELNEPIGEIVFDKVSFSYKDNERKLLDNCSYKFQAGKKYFITGDSGIGKSTIFKLLQKQITNYSGTININNKDIRQVDNLDYFGKIGFCSQETKLFSLDIKNNIVLLNENIDHDKLEETIEKTGLSNLVSAKEYQTNVKEKLSGGEKQRVNIARALYHDFEVLCFDESTASLGSSSRREIEKYILKLENKMVLYISHNYDKDIFDAFDYRLKLEEGKLKEY